MGECLISRKGGGGGVNTGLAVRTDKWTLSIPDLAKVDSAIITAPVAMEYSDRITYIRISHGTIISFCYGSDDAQRGYNTIDDCALYITFDSTTGTIQTKAYTNASGTTRYTFLSTSYYYVGYKE